jgi:two-component system sensor histidine kinase KdpD
MRAPFLPRGGLVLVGALVVTAGLTALLRAVPHVSPTTVALLLLLVVLGTAIIADLRVAIVVSLVATLTLNYFFIPPVGTFMIADPQNWVALFAFLVVAVIASKLSTAARDRALARQKADLAATLLASLSHHLRTPLTAIRVAVDNMSGSLSTDARRAQGEAATAELDRLTRLFQHILDMARIDAAAISVQRQWVAPADVVDAAGALVRHALDRRDLRVDAESDREVEIDPRLASGALSHLLENASHYSSVDREIAVRAWVEPDGLHVTVTDHGPGVDADELGRLFEQFYRGRAARQQASGTGMGLSITRGLLAAAGGRVWAENVPGAGARFSMIVPGPVRPATTTGS